MLITTTSDLLQYRKAKQKLKDWETQLEEIENIQTDEVRISLRHSAEYNINQLKSEIQKFIKCNLHSITNFTTYRKYSEFNHNDKSEEYYQRVSFHDFLITEDGSEYAINAHIFSKNTLSKFSDGKFYIDGKKVISMYKNMYIDVEDYKIEEFVEKIGLRKKDFKPSKTGNGYTF